MGTWLYNIGQSQGLRVHTVWTLVSLILFVGGLILGVQMGRPSGQPILDEDAWSMALCTRVIDGDTIVVQWQGNEERVRILGIDAPETRRTRSLRAQAELLNMDVEFLLAYGDVATRTVEMWLLNRQVKLVFPEEGQVLRDAFGRLLCYVELQGTDIGERLLLGGNAFVYEAPHPREEAYKAFQAEAQRQRRGIWRNL